MIARAPFSAAALDGAATWNAQLVGSLDSWPEERYLEYLAGIEDPEEILGVGAGHRVAYSPGLVQHLFESYARTFACLPELPDLEPGAPGLDL